MNQTQKNFKIFDIIQRYNVVYNEEINTIWHINAFTIRKSNITLYVQY